PTPGNRWRPNATGSAVSRRCPGSLDRLALEPVTHAADRSDHAVTETPVNSIVQRTHHHNPDVFGRLGLMSPNDVHQLAAEHNKAGRAQQSLKQLEVSAREGNRFAGAGSGPGCRVEREISGAQ